MAETRPPQRKRFFSLVFRTLAIGLVGLIAAPSYAELRPRGRPRVVPAMRFVRVTSADPACNPNCPEWMSAEGRIEPGTAAVFADVIASLKGRRLPILIHSPGGSVADAGAMGELIRAKGLAVAVARTLISNCAQASPKCPDGPGVAITGGATCASACVLVLAGGVERLAAPSALIGVHRTTTLVSETEGLAHLKSTRKIYESQGVDAAIAGYLNAMGVGEPVMTLVRKTWAASIRWLSIGELQDSHLATGALDAAQPILASGANGLNAKAFDGDPRRAEFMQARLVRPLASAAGTTLEIAFRYRRGGGAVEAEAIERGPDALPAGDASFPDLTLSGPGVEAMSLQVAGKTPARTLIPRERFCALVHAGASVAAAAGEPQGLAPVELAALDGAPALIAEACP